MGPQEDYIETVLTCEGDYYDPDFHNQLQDFSQRLQDLLVTDQQQLVIKKVEPWNSVRVTFNIPKEAAVRLRRLAEQGDQTLRELGILAVQIEGDRVISLTIAGKNNEPTELVFQTAVSGAAPPRQVSMFESFEASSSDEIGNTGPSNVETTRKNITQYLRQQGTGDNIFETIFSQPGASVEYKMPSSMGNQPEPRHVRQNNPVPFPLGSPNRSPSHSAGAPGQLPFPSRSPPGYPSPSHTQSLQSFPSPGSSRSQPSPSGQLSPRFSTPPPQLQHLSQHHPGSPGVRLPQQVTSLNNQAPGSLQGQVTGGFQLPLSYQHGHVGNQQINNLRVGANKDITSSSPLLVNLLQSDPAAHFNNLPQHKMPPPFDSGPTPKRKRRKKKNKPALVGNMEVDNVLQMPIGEGRVPQLGMDPHLTNSTSPVGSGSNLLASSTNLTSGSAHSQMGRSPIQVSPDKSSAPRHIINPYTGKLEPVDTGDDSTHKMESSDNLEHTGQLQPPPNPLVALERRLARDSAALMQDPSSSVTGESSPTGHRGSPRFLNPASQTTVPPPSRVHNIPPGTSHCVSSGQLPVMSSTSSDMSVATSNSFKGTAMPHIQESHFHHPSVSEPPSQDQTALSGGSHSPFSRGMFPSDIRHRMDIRAAGMQIGPGLREIGSGPMRHPGPPFAHPFREQRPPHLGNSTGIPVRATSTASWPTRTSTMQHLHVNPASSSGLASGHRSALYSGPGGRHEHSQFHGDLRLRMPGVPSSRVHPSLTVTTTPPSSPWLATTAVSSERARTSLTTALPHGPVANPGTMPHSAGQHPGTGGMFTSPTANSRVSTGVLTSVASDTNNSKVRTTVCSATPVTTSARIVCTAAGGTVTSVVTGKTQAALSTVTDTSSTSVGNTDRIETGVVSSQESQRQSCLTSGHDVVSSAVLATTGSNAATSMTTVHAGHIVVSERITSTGHDVPATTTSAEIIGPDMTSNDHNSLPKTNACMNVSSQLEVNTTGASGVHHEVVSGSLIPPRISMEGKETALCSTVSSAIAEEMTAMQKSGVRTLAASVTASVSVSVIQESIASVGKEPVCTNAIVHAPESKTNLHSSPVNPACSNNPMSSAETQNSADTIQKGDKWTQKSGPVAQESGSADTGNIPSSTTTFSLADSTNNNKVMDTSPVIPNVPETKTKEMEPPQKTADFQDRVDMTPLVNAHTNVNGGEEVTSPLENNPVTSTPPSSSPPAHNESGSPVVEACDILKEDPPIAVVSGQVIGSSNGTSASETSPMSDATVTSSISHGPQGHSPVHNSVTGHVNHDSELSSHSFDDIRLGHELTNASPREGVRLVTENHDSGLSSQSTDGEPNKEAVQPAADNAPPKDNVDPTNVITVGYALSKEGPVDLAPLKGLSDKLLTPGLKGLDSVPYLTKPGIGKQDLDPPETSKGIALSEKLVVENPLVLNSKPHVLVREVHLPQSEGPSPGQDQDTSSTEKPTGHPDSTHQIHLNWHDKTIVPSKYKEKCDLNPGGVTDTEKNESCSDSLQVNGEGMNMKGGCREPSAMLMGLGACNSESWSNDGRDSVEHSDSHLTEQSVTSPSQGSIGDKMLDDTLEDTTINSDKVSVSSLTSASTSADCSAKADWINTTSDSSLDHIPIPLDIHSGKDELWKEHSSADKESQLDPCISDHKVKITTGDDCPSDGSTNLDSLLDSKAKAETEKERAAIQIAPVTPPLEGRMVAHSSGGQIQKQDASPQYGDTPPESSTEGLPPTMESSELSSAAVHLKMQLGTKTLEVASDVPADKHTCSNCSPSSEVASMETEVTRPQDEIVGSATTEMELASDLTPVKQLQPSLPVASTLHHEESTSGSHSSVALADESQPENSCISSVFLSVLPSTSKMDDKSELMKKCSSTLPQQIASIDQKKNMTVRDQPKTNLPPESNISPSKCDMKIPVPKDNVDKLFGGSEQFSEKVEKDISLKVKNVELLSSVVQTSVSNVGNETVLHGPSLKKDDLGLSNVSIALAPTTEGKSVPTVDLPVMDGKDNKSCLADPVCGVQEPVTQDEPISSELTKTLPLTSDPVVQVGGKCVSSTEQKEPIPSINVVTSSWDKIGAESKSSPKLDPVPLSLSDVPTKSVLSPDTVQSKCRSGSVASSVGSSAASLVSSHSNPSVGSSTSSFTSVTSVLDTRMTTSISIRDVTSQDSSRHVGFPVLSISDTDSRIVLKCISPTERANKDYSLATTVTVTAGGALRSSVAATQSKTTHVNTAVVTSVLHPSGIKSSQATLNITKPELNKQDVRPVQPKGISIMQPLIEREAEIEDDPDLDMLVDKKKAVLLNAEKEPGLLKPEEMIQIHKAGASLDSAKVQLLPQMGPAATFTIAELIEDTKPSKTDINTFIKGPVEDLFPYSSQAKTQTVMNATQIKTTKSGLNKGQQLAGRSHTAASVVDFPRNSSVHLSNFVQKSIHTPSLVNSAPHPITSPGFPLNLTESVQKIMQAIPKENPSPPPQPPKLNRPASGLSATKTIVIPPGKSTIAGSSDCRQEGTLVIVLAGSGSSAGSTVSGFTSDNISANQHSKSPGTVMPLRDKSPSQAARLSPVNRTPSISPCKSPVDIHRGQCSTSVQLTQEPLSVTTSLPQSSQNTVPRKSPVRTVSVTPESRVNPVCNPHVEHNYISPPRSHDIPSHSGSVLHSRSDNHMEKPTGVSIMSVESRIQSIINQQKLMSKEPDCHMPANSSREVIIDTVSEIPKLALPTIPKDSVLVPSTLNQVESEVSVQNKDEQCCTQQSTAEIQPEQTSVSVIPECGEAKDVAQAPIEGYGNVSDIPKIESCATAVEVCQTPAKSARITRRSSLEIRQSPEEAICQPARITRRSSRESTESLASNSDSVKTPSSRGRKKSISECSDGSTDWSTRSVRSERSEEREISPSIRNTRRSGRKKTSPDGPEDQKPSEGMSESHKVTRCSKRKLALDEGENDEKKTHVEDTTSDTVPDEDGSIKNKSKGPSKCSSKGLSRMDESEKAVQKSKRASLKEDSSPVKGANPAMKTSQSEAVDVNLDDHTYSGTKRTKAKSAIAGRGLDDGSKVQVAATDGIAPKSAGMTKRGEKRPWSPQEEVRGRGRGTGKEADGEPMPGAPTYKRATRSTRQKDHYELPPPPSKRRRSSRDHR